MSDTLLPLYADSYIENSYRSDHTPIGLDIHIQKIPKGPGFWKINNSLLLNEDLNKAIKDEMDLIVETYACTPYHPDFLKSYRSNDIELMIDIKNFWDTLHAQIRGLLISDAGKKKREMGAEENRLNKKIEILGEEFILDPDDLETLNKIKVTKQ